MYKLILVASAVNVAAEEAVHTSQLVDSLCALITLAPDAVPMMLGGLVKSYLPKVISTNVEVDDLSLTNDMVRSGCESYKSGESSTEALLLQWGVIRDQGATLVAKKGATLLLGKESEVVNTAVELAKTWQKGGLENMVQRASAFVDIVSKVDSDKATQVSFENILPKKEATQVRKSLTEVKIALAKAKKEGVTTIKCNSPIDLSLREIFKNGFYEEALSRTPGGGEGTGEMGKMIKKVAVRASVSAAVKSLVKYVQQCEDPASGSRILLA